MRNSFAAAREVFHRRFAASMVEYSPVNAAGSEVRMVMIFPLSCIRIPAFWMKKHAAALMANMLSYSSAVVGTDRLAPVSRVLLGQCLLNPTFRMEALIVVNFYR